MEVGRVQKGGEIFSASLAKAVSGLPQTDDVVLFAFVNALPPALRPNPPRFRANPKQRKRMSKRKVVK